MPTIVTFTTALKLLNAEVEKSQQNLIKQKAADNAEQIFKLMQEDRYSYLNFNIIFFNSFLKLLWTDKRY